MLRRVGAGFLRNESQALRKGESAIAQPGPRAGKAKQGEKNERRRKVECAAAWKRRRRNVESRNRNGVRSGFVHREARIEWDLRFRFPRSFRPFRQLLGKRVHPALGQARETVNRKP